MNFFFSAFRVRITAQYKVRSIIVVLKKLKIHKELYEVVRRKYVESLSRTFILSISLIITLSSFLRHKFAESFCKLVFPSHTRMTVDSKSASRLKR